MIKKVFPGLCVYCGSKLEIVVYGYRTPIEAETRLECCECASPDGAITLVSMQRDTSIGEESDV